jgi:hypothetical protein
LFGGGSPVLPVALLIVGINGIIAILLPYTAESFPLRVRGRATGWVAACTKGGRRARAGAVDHQAGAERSAWSPGRSPCRLVAGLLLVALVRARDARRRSASARRGDGRAAYRVKNL